MLGKPLTLSVIRIPLVKKAGQLCCLPSMIVLRRRQCRVQSTQLCAVVWPLAVIMSGALCGHLPHELSLLRLGGCGVDGCHMARIQVHPLEEGYSFNCKHP